MKRTVTVIVLVIVAFAAIVVARLPAGWVLPATGADFTCGGIAGTLWSGYCTGLQVRGASLGDLAWRLRPARLLAGKLAAHIDLEHPPTTSARADLELSLGGTLIAHDLTASLPLDPRLLPGIPPTLTGTLHLSIGVITVTKKGVIERLEGRIEAHDIIDSSGFVTPLGNFAVSFPGGTAQPIGEVTDLGGPLAVQGQLVLTPQPGYDLSGYVTPRATAAPALLNALSILGSPDAQGRRQFALQGTY